MEKKRLRTGLKEQYLAAVLQMRADKNLSAGQLSKIFGLHVNTIRYWIRNFANETDTKTTDSMKKKNNDTTGQREAEGSSLRAMEEENARLRAALRKAELRADAYDEMINLAEARFKICIRKKSGAKQ